MVFRQGPGISLAMRPANGRRRLHYNDVFHWLDACLDWFLGSINALLPSKSVYIGFIILKPYDRILGLRPASETLLQSNAVSHWLGANLESALCMCSLFSLRVVLLTITLLEMIPLEYLNNSGALAQATPWLLMPLFLALPGGRFTTWINLIPAWINKYMPSKIWDEIIIHSQT